MVTPAILTLQIITQCLDTQKTRPVVSTMMVGIYTYVTSVNDVIYILM